MPAHPQQLAAPQQHAPSHQHETKVPVACFPKLDVSALHANARVYDNAGRWGPAFDPEHIVLQGAIQREAWVCFDPFTRPNYDPHCVNATILLCLHPDSMSACWRGHFFALPPSMQQTLRLLAIDCYTPRPNAIYIGHWDRFCRDVKCACYAWWMGCLEELPSNADLETIKELLDEFSLTARGTEPTQPFDEIAGRLGGTGYTPQTNPADVCSFADRAVCLDNHMNGICRG